ncbi:MAG: heavy metal-associated domain-containing protein [Clostridium sp.]
MKKFKCEAMMCNNCVTRIDKALTEAGMIHEVNLADKTVSIEGDEATVSRAVGILDDLGFDAEMV